MKWISVDDRLPETTDDVLMYCYEEEQPDVCYFEFYAIGCYVKKRWLMEGRRMHDVDHVTHWAALPKPPTAKHGPWLVNP